MVFGHHIIIQLQKKSNLLQVLKLFEWTSKSSNENWVYIERYDFQPEIKQCIAKTKFIVLS